MGLTHPITALRRMRRAVRRRCHMRSLIDSMGDAMIGTGLDTRITTWNAAAEDTFGYTGDEIVGKPLALLFPAAGYSDVERVLEGLGNDLEVDHAETTATRKDGSRLEVGLTVSLVDDGAGSVTGFSLVARDVTEERRMRSQLTDTVQDLEAALGEAREGEARERGLLADVAHQLRSPIAGVRATTDVLLRGVSASTRDRLLVAMMRETSRADRLLTALLQMARLEDGHSVNLAPCDLEALCHEEVSRAASMSPRLALLMRSGDPLPYKPQVDAAAVREIVSNLLDNARRHAKSRVEVALTAAGPVAEVRVVDDGPGMAAGMVEKAFERFVSLDGKGGTGLGLPIARSLARAHGGDLTYEERAFVLRLPATPSTGM